MSAPTTTAKDMEFLGPDRARRLRNGGLGLLGIGLALSGAGWASDHHRFLEGYLVGFEFVLTLCLGALFFVLIQHLTKAGWSVGLGGNCQVFYAQHFFSGREGAGSGIEVLDFPADHVADDGWNVGFSGGHGGHAGAISQHGNPV